MWEAFREHLEVLWAALIALGIVVALTPAVGGMARLLGVVDNPGGRRINRRPIPRLGGLAMFIGFLVPSLAFLDLTRELRGILIGAAVATTVGAIDDFRGLPWLPKLAGQAAAAAIPTAFGVWVDHFTLPFVGVHTLSAWVGIPLTVVWILAIMNMVNFLDGLDGLAAGVVGIAALAFFIYSYLLSKSYFPANVFTNAAFVTAAVLGCCVGFLPHNFHPARLFMGDSGALLLGLLLASATISITGNVDPSQFTGGSVTAALLPIVVPLAVLSLPFLDMVFAVVRRTLAGQRPWHPDAKHLHHRMLEIGHGHRTAVLILYLWAALLSLGTVSFAFVEGWRAALGIAVASVAAVALTVWLPRWSAARRL